MIAFMPSLPMYAMSSVGSSDGKAAMRLKRGSGTKCTARDTKATSTIYHFGLSLSVFYKLERELGRKSSCLFVYSLYHNMGVPLWVVNLGFHCDELQKEIFD